MLRPLSERQLLEQEREELPAQVATYRREVAAGLADKTRREWLEWQIRWVEKRMATVRGWLAENVPADG